MSAETVLLLFGLSLFIKAMTIVNLVVLVAVLKMYTEIMKIRELTRNGKGK